MRFIDENEAIALNPTLLFLTTLSSLQYSFEQLFMLMIMTSLCDFLKGAFGLVTHVWDDDSNNILGIGGEDDRVDIYRMNVHVAAGRSERNAVERRFYARGRRSSLGFLVRYFFNTCSMY